MDGNEQAREMLASVGDLIEQVLRDRHDALCGQGFCPDTWKALGELGLLAAALPEEQGGMGAGPTGHAVLMESFGRHLVAQPFLSSIVMASVLLDGEGEGAEQRLGALGRGEHVIVPALADDPFHPEPGTTSAIARIDADGVQLDGRKMLVRDAPLADDWIVLAKAAGDASGPYCLLLVPAKTDGVLREDFDTVDRGVGSHLRFDGVRLGRASLIVAGPAALARAESAIDHARAALCAEAVGIMQAMLDLTVAYARQRVQFGQPLASFQVLQHRMVDMYVAVEQAQSITRLAQGKLSTGERAAAVSASMALVLKHCRSVAQDAVQIHGAIGIADETPISRYFRRALAIEKQFGGRQYHLDRYIAGRAAPFQQDQAA